MESGTGVGPTLLVVACLQLGGMALLAWWQLARSRALTGEQDRVLMALSQRIDAGLCAARNEAAQGAKQAQMSGQHVLQALGLMGTGQAERLDGFATMLGELRAASENQARASRQEMVQALERIGSQLQAAGQEQQRTQAAALQQVATSIRELTTTSERRQEVLKQALETRLDALRQDNASKLEQMRQTVDEKLQGTLEKRLGASFSLVNQNLERVFKSVGEMQAIATGVGDLKRVLLNVKSRGTWGETSLGALLEQIMTAEQFDRNVEVVPGSNQRVEFAICLPQDGAGPLWLPIDAKLPTEDYERLADAAERGDAAAVEEAGRAVERAVRLAGKTIAQKYVCPPHTTDFAVMYLPTEGLFAEVVRRPGLLDGLQREHRIVVTGPTTLGALLTSLRMGFRTLAIQRRSSEVWEVLGAVKSEFGRFGAVLDKVTKKLDEASNVVRDAGTRKRAVERHLRQVEATSPDLFAAPLAEVAQALSGPPTEAERPSGAASKHDGLQF